MNFQELLILRIQTEELEPRLSINQYPHYFFQQVGPTSERIVKMEVKGSRFFVGGGVERRGGGRHFLDCLPQQYLIIISHAPSINRIVLLYTVKSDII